MGHSNSKPKPPPPGGGTNNNKPGNPPPGGNNTPTKSPDPPPTTPNPPPTTPDPPPATPDPPTNTPASPTHPPQTTPDDPTSPTLHTDPGITPTSPAVNTPITTAETPAQSQSLGVDGNSNGSSSNGSSSNGSSNGDNGQNSNSQQAVNSDIGSGSRSGGSEDKTASPPFGYSSQPQFLTNNHPVLGPSSGIFPDPSPSASVFSAGSGSGSGSGSDSGTGFPSIGAASAKSNKTAGIIAGVLVPVFLFLFAGAAYVAYKRRQRLRDRREWERTHAEIADAVANVGGAATGTPTAWTRFDSTSRGDLLDHSNFNEKMGTADSHSQPFFEGQQR